MDKQRDFLHLILAIRIRGAWQRSADRLQSSVSVRNVAECRIASKHRAGWLHDRLTGQFWGFSNVFGDGRERSNQVDDQTTIRHG